MPRWVGDVLEAIFIIALGAIVFLIFYTIFDGGVSSKSGKKSGQLSGLGGKIQDFADDVMNDASDDVTIAPRFTGHLINGVASVSNFLLK